MTPAARRNLIRLAKRCSRAGSWSPLVAWVEAYRASPPEPPSGEMACVAPDDAPWLRRFVAWWRG